MVGAVALVSGSQFPLAFRGQIEGEAVAGLLAQSAEKAVGVHPVVYLGGPGLAVVRAAQVLRVDLNSGHLAGGNRLAVYFSVVGFGALQNAEIERLRDSNLVLVLAVAGIRFPADLIRGGAHVIGAGVDPLEPDLGGLAGVQGNVRADLAVAHGVIVEIQDKIVSGGGDVQGDNAELGLIGVKVRVVHGGVPGDFFGAGANDNAAGAVALEVAEGNGRAVDLAVEGHAENRIARVGRQGVFDVNFAVKGPALFGSDVGHRAVSQNG